MRVYLDASVLVAMFTDDAFTERADALLRNGRPIEVVVSDFAAAEFASAVARKVRIRTIKAAEGRTAFANFDTWTASAAGRVEAVSADIGVAAVFLRRLDLPLRTADAINIAVAQRLGAELATFDVKMSQSAKALGSPLAAL